jgi:NADH dehydrogenase [ubiquinone] 1 alpha subcomplex assembly factor 6
MRPRISHRMTGFSTKEPSDAAYAADQVRAHDPERWLTLLLAPRPARDDLAALYGFNLEIAKTAEVTREPLIGAMRLQWWRDAVAAIFEGGQVPRHEIAQPLARAIHAHLLPRAPFDALLEARELDLEPGGPPDLDAVAAYAAQTGGGLAALALRIAGAEGEAALRAAQHVGTGWALLGLLRATPFLATRRRTLLPADLRQRHGVTDTALFAGRSDGLAEVVAPIAARAREELAQARALRTAVPRRARPTLLLAALADAHLADLARAGFDPFRLPEPRRDAALRLAWRWLRGRY